jgi:hypothetical protein
LIFSRFDYSLLAKEKDLAFGATGAEGANWEKVATVIGRSLAFLCLQYTSAKDGTMLERAEFLRALGLPYSDSAGMLGSTEASLKELARLAKKPKGARGARQAKAKTRAKAKRAGR